MAVLSILPGLAIAAEEHHGHWHDQDGYEIEEGRPVGHAHSHNASDHSHVAMTGVTPPTSAPLMVRMDWQQRILVSDYTSPLYSLERPPRSPIHA